MREMRPETGSRSLAAALVTGTIVVVIAGAGQRGLAGAVEVPCSLLWRHERWLHAGLQQNNQTVLRQASVLVSPPIHKGHPRLAERL